jgi:hypothetical protein
MAKAAYAVLENWYKTQEIAPDEKKDHWLQLFAGIGFGQSDPNRAQEILAHSLLLQTADGRVPKHTGHDPSVLMLPYHAVFAWLLYRQSKDKTAFLDWLRPLFPKMIAAQEHWYQHRDEEEDGLIALHFSTESPLANASIWHSSDVEDQPKIQDAAWHSLFCWASECIIDLGKVLKTNVSSIIDGLDLTIYSLNEKLWDEEYGIYRSYNLVQNDSILSGSIGGLLPLAGGIPNQEQAEMIRQALEANFIQSDFWWLPTYSLNSPQIQSDQLGQGSIDPIVNWLMYYGLLRYDFTDLAELLRRNTLQLIKEYGFYPAYDAKKQDIGNVGLGSGNFGPAAAVYLDLAAKKAVRNSIK